jgi:hypothetical protein
MAADTVIAAILRHGRFAPPRDEVTNVMAAPHQREIQLLDIVNAARVNQFVALLS